MILKFDDEPVSDIDSSNEEETDKSIDDLPPELVEKLFGFQKEGVKFGIKKGCRFLLGDEMGIGKTIQSLSVAFVYQNEWPLLVICPASLKYTWRDEAMKWLPGLDDIYIQIIETGAESFNL